jgi:hypothetical protein
MTTLEKFVESAAAAVTPPVGGRVPANLTNGLPGYMPEERAGFYPTAPYADLRTFVNGEGKVEVRPESYLDYRLNGDLLLHTTPVGLEEATQLIENNLRGQFDRSLPYVYTAAAFNSVQPDTRVEPVPGFSEQKPRFAWDAGALTSDCFASNGRISFSATAATFAVVGLVGPGADPIDPAAAEYAFLLRSVQAVAVIERGVVAELGSAYFITPSTVFSVRIVDGVVTYLVDATVVRTTPVTPPTTLPVVYQGIASLYFATSYISGVSVTGLAGATVQLRPFRIGNNPASAATASVSASATAALTTNISLAAAATATATATANLP